MDGVGGSARSLPTPTRMSPAVIESGAKGPRRREREIHRRRELRGSDRVYKMERERKRVEREKERKREGRRREGGGGGWSEVGEE